MNFWMHANTSEERQTLQTLVRKGEHSVLKLMRAHILLKADSNGPDWTDAKISEAFGCHEQTAYNVRKRFATGERLAALERKRQSRPSRLPKLDVGGDSCGGVCVSVGEPLGVGVGGGSVSCEDG